MTIKGGSYISTTSTSQRSAVHSLPQDGVDPSLTILDATIVSETPVSQNRAALEVEGGTVTIGLDDGVISNTTPVLQGINYAILTKNSPVIDVYDGILKGSNGVFTGPGTINYHGSQVTGNETIGSTSYSTLHLQ